MEFWWLSSPTCNTPLWPLIELDGQLERPPSINQLVMSSPSTYMIVQTLLSLWQKPNLFLSYTYMYVLKGGGWRLHLLASFLFWSLEECGVFLHHHPLPGPLWPGVVVPVRILSMGWIDKKWVYKKVFKKNIKLNTQKEWIKQKYIQH